MKKETRGRSFRNFPHQIVLGVQLTFLFSLDRKASDAIDLSVKKTIYFSQNASISYIFK